MGAKPSLPAGALRADSSVGGDSTAGEDTLAGVVFSNTQAPTSESQGGFFNLEHYVRDHERRMSTPNRPAGGSLAKMDADLDARSRHTTPAPPPPRASMW